MKCCLTILFYCFVLVGKTQPFVSVNDPSVINQNQHVRQTSNTNASIIDGILPNNYLVISQVITGGAFLGGTKWGRVDIPGTTGAISGYVALGVPAMLPMCNNYYVSINTSSINVRTDAGTSNPSVTISGSSAKVFSGQNFALVSTNSISSGGYNWYQIYLTTNCSQSTGWIASQNWVTVNQSSKQVLDVPTISQNNITSSSVNISATNAINYSDRNYDFYINNSKQYSSNFSGSNTPNYAPVTDNTVINNLSPCTQYSIYAIERNSQGCYSSNSSPVSMTTTGNCSNPSITLNNITPICMGDPHAALPYSAPSGNPVKFSIRWNSSSISDIVDNPINASPLTIPVQLQAPAGSYNGLLTLTDANGNKSVEYPIVLVIKAKPTVEPIVLSTGNPKGSICIGPTEATVSDATTGGVWNISDPTKAYITYIGPTPIVAISTLAAADLSVSYTVTNSDGCNAIATAPFTISAPTGPLNPIAGNTNISVGNTSTLTNTTIGTDGRWSTGDASKATIDANGKVTGISAGTMDIYYSITTLNGCTANISTQVAITNNAASQCPSVVLTNTGVNCSPALSVSGTVNAEKITWYNGNNIVSTFTADNSSGLTIAGGNGQGASLNQLDSPTGLFVDATGNIYIADQANKRIQKWTAGVASGVIVAGGNGAGISGNQLFDPLGVFVDNAGNIYIADGAANRVQKWPVGASAGYTVAGGNGSGSGLNQLNNPTNIFVDKNGNVYVADRGNHRIQKWAQGASSGVTVAGGNGQGASLNQLDNPTGIFVDANDNIYIADRNNHRVQKWANGSTQGTTVSGGNNSGNNANQLSFPFNIYVDCYNNVYVADAYNQRIQKWSSGASTGITIAGGNLGSGLNQLNNPLGIYLDGTGAAYIADQNNHRIQKWNQTINTKYTPSAIGTYTATVNFGGSANVVSNPIAITEVSAPPKITASGNLTFCVGSNVLLTSNAATGNQWYKDGTVLPGETNSTYQALTSGNYKVSIILASGCVAAGTSTEMTVKANNLPVVLPISGSTSICAGATTSLSTSSINGLWSSSNNYATISDLGLVSGLSAGSAVLKYTITDNNGCKGEQTKTVQIYQSPAVSNITGNSSVCIGTKTSLTETATGGVWSSNNELIATIDDQGVVSGITNGSAVIKYEVVNQNGCSANVTLPITVNGEIVQPVLDQGFPSNTKITTLNTCSFAVNVTSAASQLSYQWQVSIDGGNLWTDIKTSGTLPVYSNWNTKELTLNTIALNNDGFQYRCVVTNANSCGTLTTTSKSAILAVSQDCIPPTISSNPENQSVIETFDASFSVTATNGAPPYSYQWEVSTDGGNNWVNITSKGTSPSYSNWNDKTLGLTGVSINNNNYKYKCVIQSASPCSTATSTSNEAILSVGTLCVAPIINVQPVSTTVTASSSTSFSVTPDGYTSQYNYQWQLSTDGGKNWNNIYTTGSQPIYAFWGTSTLTLTGITKNNDGYQYQCIITSNSGCGSYPTTSNAATLTVSSTCVTPTILTQPQNASVAINAALDLSVAVTGGTTPYSYQWQVSKDNSGTWNAISSNGSSPTYSNWNSPTLNISGLSLNNNYQYKCKITSAAPCSSSSISSNAAVVTVNQSCTPPSISSQPQNSTVVASSSTTFNVNVNGGTTPYTYQWQVSTNGGNNWSTITNSGSSPVYSDWNTPSLSLSSISEINTNYLYKCIISSGTPCGAYAIISNYATLIVSSACSTPQFLNQPADATLTASTNASTNFTISVNNGNAPYTYQWQVSSDGSNWGNITSSGSSPTYSSWDKATLTVSNPIANNNNFRYRCVVTSSLPCGSYSNTSNAAILSVTTICQSPTISSDPADISITTGSDATFSVQTTGGVQPYSYQWQVSSDGSNWSNISSSGSSPTYSNWTKNTLSLSNTVIGNSTFKYRCMITSASPCNSKSIVSGAAGLTVKNTIIKYTINVSASQATSGSVAGGSTYNSGDAVTVVASPNAGWKFLNWTENGIEVSNVSSYPFKVSSNRKIVANFVADVIAYLEIGSLRVYANKIPTTGNTRTLSGNVYVTVSSGCSNPTTVLHLPDNVSVNISSKSISGSGTVYCSSVGNWGNISLFNSTFILLISNDVIYTSIFDQGNIYYKLAGLNLEINDLQVQCNDIKIEGKLGLPNILKSNATKMSVSASINSLYLSNQGLDLAGEIDVKNISLGSIIQLDDLNILYDTKTKDFSGSIQLNTPAIDIGASIALSKGKIDQISLSISPSYIIPFFETGLKVKTLTGSVTDFTTTTPIFGFEAKLVPIYDLIPSVGDLSLKAYYTFNTKFNASGTLSLFTNKVANIGMTVSKNLYEISGDLNIYDIILCNAYMSISNYTNSIKLRSSFSANVVVPKVFPSYLNFLNAAIGGKKLASASTYLTNNDISGYVGVNIPLVIKNLYYSLSWRDKTFNWGKSYVNVIPIDVVNEFHIQQIIQKPSLTTIIKNKSFGLNKIKTYGVTPNRLAYSFDVKKNTDYLILTGFNNNTPPLLGVYLNKKDTLTVNNFSRFKNVLYSLDSVDNITSVVIPNPQEGTYYVWCNDVQKIDIRQELKQPTVEIKKVINNKATKELSIEYKVDNADQFSQIYFGLDEDLSNANGIMISDSVVVKQNIDSIKINYSNIKTGIFYLYGGIVDTIGRNYFTYNKEPLKIITDSAPNAPTNLQIRQDTGSIFISYDKNNLTPLNYSLHFTADTGVYRFSSVPITIGDTNYVEIKSLLGGKYYEFAVSAFDSKGRESDLSNVVPLFVKYSSKNNSPFFGNKHLPAIARVNTPFYASLLATDIDSDQLTYTIISSTVGAQIDANGLFQWVPQDTDLGFARFKVIVDDSKGGLDSLNFELFVYKPENTLPIISFNNSSFDNYSDSAIINLSDLLLLKNDSLQSVKVHVHSTTDTTGFDVSTYKSSGDGSLYLGTIYFNTSKSTNSSLKISKGDSIWVNYSSSISGNSCNNYAYFKYLKSDFVCQDTVCSSNTIQFFDASKGGQLNYHWIFGDGTESNLKNPIHKYPDHYGSGDTIYKPILIINNVLGVSDTTFRSVRVYRIPISNISLSGPAVFCQGDSVLLSTPAADQHLWSTGSNATTIVAKKTGAYYVLNTNGNICFSKDTVSILVNRLPVVNAGIDVSISLGDSIRLGSSPTVMGNGPFNYRWTPSTGLNYDTVANPIALTFRPTQYKVDVTDENKCKNSSYVTIKVSPVMMEDKIVIYPNPARNDLKFSYIQLVDGLVTISILNSNGQIVKIIMKNQKVNRGYKQFTIPFINFSSGTYYLNFNDKQIIPFFKE